MGSIRSAQSHPKATITQRIAFTEDRKVAATRNQVKKSTLEDNGGGGVYPEPKRLPKCMLDRGAKHGHVSPPSTPGCKLNSFSAKTFPKDQQVSWASL